MRMLARLGLVFARRPGLLFLFSTLPLVAFAAGVFALVASGIADDVWAVVAETGFALGPAIFAFIVGFAYWRNAGRQRPIDGERCATSVELPPGFGEMVLALIAKKEHRDAIVGDADERFATNVKRFGRKRAVRLYWAQVIRSVAPLLWAAIKRLGIATLLVDAVRRFFGGA